MAIQHGIDVLKIDARHLQGLLESGRVTSLDLVRQYVTQIQRHDSKLHAMIQTTSIDLLEQTARSLDQERADGKIRGPLHGIPITIKDNIATHPSFGLPTSAGSFALLSSKPRRNAKIIDQLVEAGLIIMGKANLSEFANARGTNMPSGWSAVGGQCQPAYVPTGVNPQDSTEGHSNPSGSSGGSAVSVAAGYAPLSIGTETDGSLVCPSGRAALYTIKPTIGLVSQEGIIPISNHFDSAGPMTKTTHDLATLFDVLASKGSTDSFTASLTGSWSDISVAVLDPSIWKYPNTLTKPADAAEAQIIREIHRAYELIRPRAKKFVENVDLISPEEFEFEGENSELLIWLADMKRSLNEYLEDLEESEVRSLAEVIEYNNKHADVELPPTHPRQDFFIESEDQRTSPAEYERHLAHLREVARDRGFEKVFKTHGVDVVIGPTDSGLRSLAAAGGYPVCGMPLGYLDYNGRAFGMSAVARRGQDALLVKVMSAWEATLPPRKTPRWLE
ncbi:hypothetical protein N7509_012532 [Penicillium cosmopolitanum]|uniref:Amidase domain-containing protein n=1 Tax=Penicillium cosmopolitanum TaxID=1131564 RepID=A0A9W9SJ11_9EURO|nr:uncharacterized protein N7509_012532 [Penicillium cosmopolitanum]KAJ5379413.1 hypothetical protein N7509_012532 [Penicillium cosmopolitanum]